MSRGRLATAVTAGAVVLAVVVPGVAAGASRGPCPGPDGVTVVVDATPLGGGVQVGCAPGSPASGLDALRAAGFAVRGTARFPGFVCRIDGAPAADPCLDTAPADAYWSYWHASRGGAWTYSDTGAAERTPPAGTVEGWVFSDGSGRSPGLAPPAPSAPVTTPPPAPVTVPPPAPVAVAGVTTLPGPGAPPPGAPSDSGAAAAGAPGPAAVAGPLGAEPATVPVTGPEGGTTVGDTGPGDSRAGTDGPGGTGADTTDASGSVGSESGAPTDERAGADGPGVESGDTGSPVATLVGLGLVAAVGTAAVVTVRRRRTGPEGP